MKKRGFIAREKRAEPLRVDHNALVLEGTLDRVREIESGDGNGKPESTPAAPALRQLAPRIGYVAVRPGSTPRDLTPATAAVFSALGKRPKRIGDLVSKLQRVHPNTIRWAVQILRQRKLVKSIELS